MLSKVIIFVGLALAANANLELWNHFKLQHGKAYGTQAEQALRYAIFTNNLAKIAVHNNNYQQGLVSWYLGINQFADLTADEFAATLTARQVYTAASTNSSLHVPKPLQIPQSIDWRQSGVVTGIKNQGGCGSCWTFSATGTLEGAYAIKYGQLLSFSEQNIMDCCTDATGYNGAGCSGGVVQSGLDYVRDHGITTEDKYPYLAVQGSCSASADVAFKISGYTEIGYNDENDLKNAVGTAGPVSVAVNADKFQSYAGGIFNDETCSTAINHGMLVVGYGNENGQDYWIVKNSWGASWGESGYVRVAIGKNLCAMATQACYPNL